MTYYYNNEVLTHQSNLAVTKKIQYDKKYQINFDIYILST